MKLVHAILALVLVCGASAQKPLTTQLSQKTPPQGGPTGPRQVTDAKLKELEAAYKGSKAAYDKKPKDAKIKKNYVDATFAVGMGRMYSVSLSPHLKYTTALDAFREVLKVDPNHKAAKENRDMIVKIYKQMGRKVPGEN